MQITLIRHAEVDIYKNTFVYASELKRWLDIYNNADIKTDFISKDEITNIFEHSQKIICSELKRSSDSVLLYGKKVDIKDRIFNEADLPYANWAFIKLPLTLWAFLFRFMWLFGYKENGESLKEAKQRAIKATDLLVKISEKNKNITLLGHGLMNRLIANELQNRGWMSQKKMGTNNWNYGVFKLI